MKIAKRRQRRNLITGCGIFISNVFLLMREKKCYGLRNKMYINSCSLAPFSLKEKARARRFERLLKEKTIAGG